MSDRPGLTPPAPPGWVGALWQRHRAFLMFALAGGLALGVDVGLLWLVQPVLGYYGGRLLSFLSAATFTWWFNRTLTFRTTHTTSLLREYASYLSSMAVGGVVNYSAYAAAVAWLPLARAYPALGVALGSLLGLGLNFWSAKRLLHKAA
jgi:putative flippase GtrA